MHITAFIVYTVLITWLSLRQGSGTDIAPWDKALHFLFYYIFAVFGYRALRFVKPVWLVYLGIIAYGI